MNFKALTLLCMIFMHIVDDYYLQGCLAKFKCKSWWKENAPDDMYRKDYLIALVMHGFSWSFMVHVPVLIFLYIYHNNSTFNHALISIIVNTFLHAFVDNLKANYMVLNLIVDQMLHMQQIMFIWLNFVFI